MWVVRKIATLRCSLPLPAAGPFCVGDEMGVGRASRPKQ